MPSCLFTRVFASYSLCVVCSLSMRCHHDMSRPGRNSLFPSSRPRRRQKRKVRSSTVFPLELFDSHTAPLGCFHSYCSSRRHWQYNVPAQIHAMISLSVDSFPKSGISRSRGWPDGMVRHSSLQRYSCNLVLLAPFLDSCSPCVKHDITRPFLPTPTSHSLSFAPGRNFSRRRADSGYRHFALGELAA
ncbi:hypothetical protein EJ02DRAFT_189910 [Clathrospora elynae]|uniref:Secreted protein n=1 Tax=Clathrospora elynae TaxID=706981 RepID=A0A6A5SPY7_9PLEO|nr:hypothetical protein EJ02DRAFT_189910 [Clathrospora elynae]